MEQPAVTYIPGTAAVTCVPGASIPPLTRFAGYFAFLGNTYPCPVISPEDGIRYPGAEWAFQAAKSEHVTDRMRIAALPTWREAKEAGRALQLRDEWDEVRKEIMLILVLAKFRQNPELAAKLTATGNRILVEGNDHGDTYWGCVGFPNREVDLPRWGISGDWAGHNYLGQILMAVRAVIS